MSDDEMSSSSIVQTLNTFADLFGKQNQETIRKLEILVTSVDELTKSHIETKKDREFASLRMSKIEDIQDTQAITLKKISDTCIRLDERVNGNKAKWVIAAQGFVIIFTAVVTSKLI